MLELAGPARSGLNPYPEVEMPCVLSPFVASLAIISAADPIIPIPTGEAGHDGLSVAIVSAGGTLRTLAQYHESKLLRRCFPSGVETWKRESRASEFSRCSLFRPVNSLIPQRIARYELFLANNYALTAELAATVRSRSAKVELLWYPLEGVQIAIGFDLLGSEFLSSLELFF